MVRRDEIDLGVWTRISPARLIVPLDTHVIRLGRCLRLTRYVSPGWRMAADITASLRALDPGRSRPLRFLHLPRRHDERLRLRPRAGGFAMSAQRALSSAGRPRTTLRLIAAFLLGVALGAAAALLVTARATDASRRRVDGARSRPTSRRMAVALEVPCAGWRVPGAAARRTGRASTRRGSSLTNRSCGEIAWTPDGETRGVPASTGSEMSSTTRRPPSSPESSGS